MLNLFQQLYYHEECHWSNFSDSRENQRRILEIGDMVSAIHRKVNSCCDYRDIFDVTCFTVSVELDEARLIILPINNNFFIPTTSIVLCFPTDTRYTIIENYLPGAFQGAKNINPASLSPTTLLVQSVDSTKHRTWRTFSPTPFVLLLHYAHSLLRSETYCITLP